ASVIGASPLWLHNALAPRARQGLGASVSEERSGGNPAMKGSGRGFVANHFDVVPVGTNDESCIVVRVVLGAQARRTIVLATRLQRRAIVRRWPLRGNDDVERFECLEEARFARCIVAHSEFD